MGNDFLLQWAPVPPASGNEGVEIAQMPKGSQGVPKQTPTGTQMIWGMNGEASLYLPSSERTRKGQGQATKLTIPR
jgi:hypothetical protein